MGELPQLAETAVRDEILRARLSAATKLPYPPRQETITADSPIPFNIRKLWFELDDYERQVFKDAASTEAEAISEAGDAETLRASKNSLSNYEAFASRSSSSPGT
jgi:hypothetical protein